MTKQIMQKKHNRVLRDSAQVKEHFKMYKVGKTWLFAGLFTISLGAGLAVSHQNVMADVSDLTEPTTTQTVAQQTTSQTDTAATSSDTQSQESTNAQTAGDTTESATQTGTTNGTTATAAKTKAASVQTTNLGDVTDQSTIDQAKATASAAYAKTGTPQQITAVAGTQGEPDTTTAETVETPTVTVENSTKVYDGKTDTPANFNVKLSDNLTAPTDWYVTSTSNEYLVSATSADLDLTQVNQNVGTYDITLSTAGLARLNAVQANQDKNLTLTTADVKAGQLSITKAPVASGSVTVEDTSKPYDNDASTDPTSYNVKLNDGLVAPTGWTVNSDGTYTVTVASGDLNADITSQEAGSYKVTLSAAGLQKINTANANYDITAAQVTAGNFKIADNTKVSVGVATISATNPALPSSLAVSVPRAEKVPDDWTISYNNAGVDSIVYSVPLSYFDFSQVDTGTLGSHPITLSNDAIDGLNASNTADMKLLSTNIKPGAIIVTTAATNAPHRGLSNFGGGFPDGFGDGHTILGDGDGTQLTLGFFHGTAGEFQNFTDVVIIPAGMTVADAHTTTVNGQTVMTYTKSTDPANSIKEQIQPVLDQRGVTYTDFKVTQLSDYNNRQAFAVQWGTVNTANQTSQLDSNTFYSVNIMVDPDVSDVTTVNYGNLQGENDATILYATDSPNLTDGKYVLDYGGAFPNNPVVATALGLSNLVTLGDTYNGSQWAGHFTIVHTPVQDTYQLMDESGTQQVGAAVATQGKVGDSYNPLKVVPAQFTAADGTEYVLDQASVPTEQTFNASTAKITAGQTVLTGATYTAKYKQVINTTTNQAKVSDQTITWGATTPANYTFTLPSNLTAPSNWTSTGNNTYTVSVNDADLDVSDIKNQVGSYDVLLSNQGLADLAAANPDYLFDNQINGVGKLNVIALNIPVTVEDTAGQQLKDPQTVSLGTNQKVAGADAGLGTDYPTSQLNTITFNYADNAQNTTGIKQATLVVNKADNTITQTTTYLDSSKPASTTTITAAELGGSDAGEGLALLLNMDETGSVIGFGVKPQITFAQATSLSAYASVKVVYNQKASATVTYVDDDNNGSVVPDTGTTLNGYIGDVLPSQVTIPENYVAASTDALPTTVTLTADDSDNLTIHLKHQLVTDTTGNITSTQTVNYAINGGDSSKTPQSKSQTITWHTITDKVTGTSYATAQAGYAAVNTPDIAGYTPNKTVVNADYPGVINTSDIKDSSTTVTYTPNKSTTTITFTGLPASKTPENKTITTTTDEAYTFDDIPTIPGYTANVTELTGLGKPTGDTLKVTYKADNNSATVTYVDDVTGTIVDTDTITGVTDQTGTVNFTAPANYEFAKDQANSGHYTITPDDTDDITVHLTHEIVYGTQETQRVIHYVIDNPNAESVPQTPATVSQTIKWQTAKDQVTGETVATAQNSVPAVTIQSIEGYTATIDGQTATEVSQMYAGATNADNLQDTDVTVTYKPNTVTATVQVPSNKGDQPVTGVSGLVDNHVQVTVPDLPGYSKDKTTVTATVQRDGTITVDNPATTGKVTYTPNPQKINVQFVDENGQSLGTTELTGVSDGTVDYQPAFEAQQDLLNQGYTLKEGNNNGLANAKTTYDHDDAATPTYVVVLSKVNNVKVTASIVPTDGDGNAIPNTTPTSVHNYPGTSVATPDIPGYTTTTSTVTVPDGRDDNTINVVYTPNPQKINVKFVDENGQSLGTTELSGVSDGTVDYQ
ncbi:KxYKxGKxW signal peptide domain-containing protein, partial [Lactobacillus sp. LC28-10]